MVATNPSLSPLALGSTNNVLSLALTNFYLNMRVSEFVKAMASTTTTTNFVFKFSTDF